MDVLFGIQINKIARLHGSLVKLLAAVVLLIVMDEYELVVRYSNFVEHTH